MAGSSLQQVIWFWFIRLIAVKAKLVLVVTSLICITCLMVSLCFYPLPSFADPNLGFETRGTKISDRITALENLLNNVKSPSRGTQDKPVFFKTDRDRFVRSTSLTNASFMKFCLQPAGEYSQIVMSGSDLWSPSSIKSMCLLETHLASPHEYRELCERRTAKSSHCCPMWSLSNYIAFLHNKTSCHQINEEDVIATKTLVDECREYFFLDNSSVPIYQPKKTPTKCRRKRAIFNIIFYLLDNRYKSCMDSLENVMVILPLAQSSSILPYYNAIDFKSLRVGNVTVSALNFGVKDAVFSMLLRRDSWLLVVGICLVTLCLFLYTSSVFLSLMTLLSLVFSMSLAYFFYTVVLNTSFFPFINLLSSVVAIGVGGDASLILIKTWWTERQNMVAKKLAKCGFGESCASLQEGGTSYEGENAIATNNSQIVNKGKSLMTTCSVRDELIDLLQIVYCDSTLPLCLTSFTTAASFFASCYSNITSISCFGLCGVIQLIYHLVLDSFLPGYTL